MSLGLIHLHTLNTTVANGLQISIKKNTNVLCLYYTPHTHTHKKKDSVSGVWGQDARITFQMQ